MSGFLLDTNIPSEALRTRPNANVAAWLKGQAKNSLFLSVVTLGELRKGVILAPIAKRSQIERSIETFIPVWFAGRILPVTRAVAERWGIFGRRASTCRAPTRRRRWHDCGDRVGAQLDIGHAQREGFRRPWRHAPRSVDQRAMTAPARPGNPPSSASEKLPAIIERAGGNAVFAAFGTLRNEHTQRAYLHAVKRFLKWAEKHGGGS